MFEIELFLHLTVCKLSQLAGAVEYNDCVSGDGSDSFNEYPGYDTKLSDGEALVMLELWEMHITPSLPLFPSLLWSRW